jgi:hypothetical protein
VIAPYPLAVFAHVVGALGLFAAMVLECVLVARLRRVETAEQARDWLVMLDVVRRLSPASRRLAWTTAKRRPTLEYMGVSVAVAFHRRDVVGPRIAR